MFLIIGYEVARSGKYFCFILLPTLLLVCVRHPRTKDDEIPALSVGNRSRRVQGAAAPSVVPPPKCHSPDSAISR